MENEKIINDDAQPGSENSMTVQIRPVRIFQDSHSEINS